MSTYTQYTGTFTKRDGSLRTMSFIKIADLPSSHFPVGQTRNALSRDGKTETVYDTKVRGFRSFNHSTRVGNLSESKINLSFDNK